MMPTRARVAVLAPSLVVAAGLALAACGGSAAGALGGKSPSQILSAGVSTAESQSSVHYVLDASGQAQSQTITGDAGHTEGSQTIVTGADQVVVELVGGTCYLKGNAGGLQHTIGLPATAAATYAGRWISVQKSDSLYQPITAAVLLDGIFRQLTPASPLQSSTPGKVSGHEVIGVKGGLPGKSAQGVTGDAVLYISTASPTLPVGFSGQASGSNHTVTEIGAFTKWGESLHLQAPTGAVAFASIPTK